MKWYILYILLIIGMVKCGDITEKRRVLRRTVRQALASIGDITTTLLPSLETDILSKCKNNGASVSTLKETRESFEKMRECLAKVQTLTIPKQEYIDKTKECTKDVYEKIKSCLPNDVKFLPEVDLEITTSLINFLYDNEETIKSTEFLGCTQKIEDNRDFQVFYVNCLRNIITRENVKLPAARSKEDFCRTFIWRNNCLSDAIADTCKNSERISNFTKGHKEAMQAACKAEATVTA